MLQINKKLRRNDLNQIKNFKKLKLLCTYFEIVIFLHSRQPIL